MKTSLITDMHCTTIRQADIELHTVSGTCPFYKRSTAVERNPGPCAGARQFSPAFPRHPSLELVGSLAGGAVDGGAEGDGLFSNSAAGAVGGAHCLSPAARALVFEQAQPAFGGYAIERTTLIDLFPRTFHIETVNRLRRAEPS